MEIGCVSVELWAGNSDHEKLAYLVAELIHGQTAAVAVCSLHPACDFRPTYIMLEAGAKAGPGGTPIVSVTKAERLPGGGIFQAQRLRRAPPQDRSRKLVRNPG